MRQETREEWKKELRIIGKIVWYILDLIFGASRDKYRSKKKYQPTLHELMDGEKQPFSDNYFIPDNRINK